MKRTLLVLCVLSLFACGDACKKRNQQTSTSDDDATTQAQRAAVPIDAPSCDLPPSNTDPLNLDEDQRIMGCPSATCGGNSHIVNSFPVNGLRTGCANAEGITLVRGSLTGSKNPECNGKDLAVNEATGELIAKNSPGCDPKDLIGARFAIESAKSSKQEFIAIETYGEANANSGELYYGYLLTDWPAPAGGAKAQSLCDRVTSNDWRANKAKLKKHAKPPVDEKLADEDKELVFYDVRARLGRAGGDKATLADVLDSPLAIVQFAEVYNIDEEPIVGPKEEWINIACVRDALAKVHLKKIAVAEANPSDEAVYLKKRQAALRMMTANYCKKKHYTARKTDIAWDSTSPLGDDPKHVFEDVEAVWNEKGAMCINHARAIYRPWVGPTPEYVRPPSCLKPGVTCIGDKTKWVQHLREDCATTPKLDACPTDLNALGGYVVSYKP